MAETTSATNTCRTCGWEVRGISRRMCGNCYRLWAVQRDDLREAAA